MGGGGTLGISGWGCAAVTLEPLTHIHLQSVVLALTFRVRNKVYQREFARRGGGRRVGQTDIQRGTQKKRIRELK